MERSQSSQEELWVGGCRTHNVVDHICLWYIRQFSAQTHWSRAPAGIGEATVRKLVASGCKVVIADVSAEKGEALAAELRGEAAFCRCDVT